MLGLPNILDAIRDFIELGGPVLYGIMAVLFLMWTFIIERYWYIKVVYPGVLEDKVAVWDARIDTRSWYAKRIREQLISEATDGLQRHITLIKTLVALCPLFGLLGTVYGMIQVFDVMAVAGTGNARAMASGVAQATIPTMAGMVAALSGVWFATHLEVQAGNEAERLEDLLQYH